jgi:hypothetical protein
MLTPPSALPFRWWMGIQRLATSHERSKSSITGKTAVQLTITAEHVCSFSLPKQHQFGKKKLSTVTIYLSVLTEIWENLGNK